MDWNTIIKQAEKVNGNIIEEQRRCAKLHEEHVMRVSEKIADNMRCQLGFALDDGKLWAEGETVHNYTDINMESLDSILEHLTKLMPVQVYGKIYKVDPLRITWYVQVNPEQGTDDEDSYF